MKRAALLALCLLLAPAAEAQAPRPSQGSRLSQAQRVELNLAGATEVAPDTVTVGERFRVVLSLWLPPGAWVELEPPEDTTRLQFVFRPRTTRPDSTSGRIRVDLEMVAWRTGLPDTAVVRARSVMPDGSTRSVRLDLRLPVVRSVLPRDTTKHVPRGPRDVWGPGRDWRLVALLAALAALLLVLVTWLLVRRRRRKPPAVSGTPKERAIKILEHARKSGLAEAGDWKGFYTLVAQALRGYAAALEPRWGADLTTSELLARMREDGVPAESLDPVAHVLRVADLAKFARHRRALDDALHDWTAARQWVETFTRAVREPEAPEPALAGAGAGAGEGVR
ncbi:MAG TPA: hypothetical protein VF746_05530 [Longimicrobium sp.]|jgi:hypothetical protein